MHWVKAKTPEGRDAYINLAAIPSMARTTDLPNNVTMLFLGGLTTVNGQIDYARTVVVETPEELLALPVLGLCHDYDARLAALASLTSSDDGKPVRATTKKAAKR